MNSLLLVLWTFAFLSVAPAAEKKSDGWEVSLANRHIDLTAHQALVTLTLSLTNADSGSLSSFTIPVDSVYSGNVAYIGAQLKLSSDVEEGKPLIVTPTTLTEKNVEAYRVLMPPVTPQSSVKVEVEIVLINSVTPFPKEITQNQKQLVQFVGNAYILSAYPIKSQSTTAKLPTANIESFSRVAPTSTSENEITYGPYSNMDAFSSARITLHYENNGPFLTILSLHRLIEVSHWGNIAVEEHVYVKHTGAVLKGPYSRFDYQRVPNSGISSVQSYKTLLPAAASDVYYRDEIGNISTSHLRVHEEYIELELRPRFPLFGGWQTRYYTGYNLPSYEYLYHSGSHYLLQMRLVDHIMDDQLVEQHQLRIVLPEGSKNIQLKAPYDVDHHPHQIMQTYLDTMGRPVVMVTKNNLVEQHIQDFELTYDFESWMLMQEPLLVVVALYGFFLFIIFVVRLDFSITKNVAVLSKQQASVILEGILQASDKRCTLIQHYLDAITSFKQSKDLQYFQKLRKNLDGKFKACTEDVDKLNKQLQSVDTESSSKVTDLQRKTRDLKLVLDENCHLAERLISERITKQNYLNEDKGNQSCLQRLQQEIDSIVKNLN